MADRRTYLRVCAYFALAFLLVGAEVYCAVMVLLEWPYSGRYVAGVVAFCALYFVWRHHGLRWAFSRYGEDEWRGVT